MVLNFQDSLFLFVCLRLNVPVINFSVILGGLPGSGLENFSDANWSKTMTSSEHTYTIQIMKKITENNYLSKFEKKNMRSGRSIQKLTH